MKKSELIYIIKEIVHKETKKIIKKEIKNQLSRICINENNSTKLINSRPNESGPAIKRLPKNSTTSAQKIYSTNSVLNKILNETRGGIEAEYSRTINQSPTGFEEYPTLNNKVFTTKNVDSLMPKFEKLGNNNADLKLKIGAVQSIKSRGLSVNDVPQAVLNNLTRNYSDVLKRSIEITKKNKGQL